MLIGHSGILVCAIFKIKKTLFSLFPKKCFMFKKDMAWTFVIIDKIVANTEGVIFLARFNTQNLRTKMYLLNKIIYLYS